MSPGSSVTLGEWTRSRVKGAAGISPRVACRRLLCFVQPSSEWTFAPVRRENSFPEKQESHLARLLVVHSKERVGRLLTLAFVEKGRSCLASVVSDAIVDPDTDATTRTDMQLSAGWICQRS